MAHARTSSPRPHPTSHSAHRTTSSRSFHSLSPASARRSAYRSTSPATRRSSAPARQSRSARSASKLRLPPVLRDPRLQVASAGRQRAMSPQHLAPKRTPTRLLASGGQVPRGPVYLLARPRCVYSFSRAPRETPQPLGFGPRCVVAAPRRMPVPASRTPCITTRPRQVHEPYCLSCGLLP